MSQDLRNRKKGNSGSATQPQKEANVVVVKPEQEEGFETKPFLREDFIDALYKPHTVTILLGIIAVLTYYAFLRYDETFTMETNVKRGIVAACIVFLVYCGVQLRDGVMMRPHPAFWRVVTGVGILYWLFLIFITFLNRDQARNFFKFLFPTLGVPLPERSYADDCRLYTPDDPDSNWKNIKDTLLDEFIIAHAIGYVGKALIMRDFKLCWVLSVSFELAEITFQHWLENFKECWWDHIIVDVFVCNAIGIWLGLKVCDLFNMRKYTHWVGVDQIPTTTGKLQRIFAQFTPYNWTNFNWDIFNSATQLFYFLGVVVGMNLVDVNAFFLKYILWIPARNPLNTYRLILWFFIGIPCIREYYQYATDKSPVKRLGANAWLGAAIIATELLIICKFSTGLFTAPFPNHITFTWLAWFLISLLWFICHFVVFSKQQREKNTGVRLFLNMLLILSFVPLIFQFVAGCPDLQWGQQEFDSFIDKYVYGK